MEAGPDTIEFRPVRVPEELAELCEFDRKAFHAYPADLFMEEEWEGFESHWMIVDGVIVGCSALLRNVDFDDEPRAGYIHIVSTGVLPEYRRRGFGRKLKEWQIAFAREEGFEVIVTNMRESNERIIKLNLDLGFEVRGVVEDFYPVPVEGAIVMELGLRGGG